MTTHEQETMTESPDESVIPTSEAPRMEDETTAVAPEPAPAVDTAAPAADTGALAADTVGDADTAGRHADAAAPPAEAPEPAAPSAEHESSTDEELFAGDDLAELRARWAGVQAAFVDDPKDCVHKADGLVSDLVEQLTAGFAQARSRLEEQWSRGEEASTEDLRLALMHYREFFERLLAV
jgi:hypothetical protein